MLHKKEGRGYAACPNVGEKKSVCPAPLPSPRGDGDPGPADGLTPAGEGPASPGGGRAKRVAAAWRKRRPPPP